MRFTQNGYYVAELGASGNVRMGEPTQLYGAPFLYSGHHHGYPIPLCAIGTFLAVNAGGGSFFG